MTSPSVSESPDTPGAESGEPVAASEGQGIPRRDWHRQLAEAVRSPDVLLERLGLPGALLQPARDAAGLFGLLVPESFLARMQPGNPDDPLLRQVLPLGEEFLEVPGFQHDALDEQSARRAAGLLQKYQGRALLIATGACAVHCRYCFRRHYPYGEEPRRLDDWEPALAELAADSSIEEVLLSGGDPLLLTDQRLFALLERLEAVPHLKRLRIHSRLPIVLPARLDSALPERLKNSRLTVWMVVHANHPAEVAGDCRDALESLVKNGIPTLNQAVLLRGVNDETATLAELSRRLIDCGVQPYYLHQLDQVTGTAHFQVPVARGKQIVAELRACLPGYAVPQYVQEIPGRQHKTVLADLSCE